MLTCGSSFMVVLVSFRRFAARCRQITDCCYYICRRGWCRADTGSRTNPGSAAQVLARSREDRVQRLETLEATLAAEICGQDHVLRRIVSIVHRGELRLSKAFRPRG